MSTPITGLQVYRASPHTTYFYIINDFLSLSSFEQENCFNQIYLVYLASFRGHSYEQFKEAMLSAKSTKKSLILYKVKGTNTVIGFSFINLDEFHYKPNDSSPQNTYLVISEFGSIYIYFQSDELYRAAYASYRNDLALLYPEVNILSFHRIMNPSFYDLICKIGSEVYPSAKNKENRELDGLLRKLMVRYNSDGGTDEKPFVILRPLRIAGDEMKVFRKNLKDYSQEFKYCAEQTGLEDNALFIVLTVEYLVEGNSLGMRAGKYVTSDVSKYDQKIYDPYLSYLAKL